MSRRIITLFLLVAGVTVSAAAAAPAARQPDPWRYPDASLDSLMRLSVTTNRKNFTPNSLNPFTVPPYALDFTRFDKQPRHPLLLKAGRTNILLHPLPFEFFPVRSRHELSCSLHLGSVQGDQVHRESGLTEFTLTDNETGEQIHIFDPDYYLFIKFQVEYEYYLTKRTGLSFLFGFTGTKQHFDLIDSSRRKTVLRYSFIGTGIRVHSSPAGMNGVSVMFYGGYAGGTMYKQPCYYDEIDQPIPESGISGAVFGIQPQFELYYRRFKTTLGINLSGAFFRLRDRLYTDPLPEPVKVFSWDLFFGFGVVI